MRKGLVWARRLAKLALENFPLRQQLVVLNRRHPHRRFRRLDRFFCVLLSRSWERWNETLLAEAVYRRYDIVSKSDLEEAELRLDAVDTYTALAGE